MIPPDNHSSRVLRDRFLETILSLAGTSIELERTDGTVYKGLFHTVSSVETKDYAFVLKGGQVGGAANDPQKYSTMFIESADVVQLKIPSIVLRSALPAGVGSFATDTDISGRSAQHLAGRALETIDSSWLDQELAEDSLETSNATSRNGGKWDQFKANEKLTGRVATYDENLYTTKIDHKKISKAMDEKAAKVAQEIEAEAAGGNIHVAQERGQKVDLGGLTEEDLHSGVLRSDKEIKAALPPKRETARSSGKAKQPFKFNAEAKTFKLSAKAVEWKPAASTPVQPAPAQVPALNMHDVNAAAQYQMNANAHYGAPQMGRQYVNDESSNYNQSMIPAGFNPAGMGYQSMNQIPGARGQQMMAPYGAMHYGNMPQMYPGPMGPMPGAGMPQRGVLPTDDDAMGQPGKKNGNRKKGTKGAASPPANHAANN